ncbi:MAG TPA: 3-phosphoserine/phosphohydroxythreonine transaminase [bacterium]|nr:3-phosphoserine/phosphohydroxythreonine transaminase [bacterium]
MEKRVHNFYAGPAALPTEVMKEAQAELLNFMGTGMSVMEISHRSKEFDKVIQEAEADMLKILGLSSEQYTVLWLGGGATHQFIMLPMNTMEKTDTADYIVTGQWAERAHEEGAYWGNAHIVATSKGEAKPYCRLPEIKKENMSDNAKYLHFTTNNTIYGTQFWKFPEPKAGIPLISDMSSDFLSRTFDASKFDMIYAGAQKNIGPAGVTAVVIKKAFAEKYCKKKLPKTLDYNVQIKKQSLFNTPPCFNIYMVGKVMKWILGKGGLAAVEAMNRKKAELIYGAIDAHPEFYKGYVTVKEHRSWMNVNFNLPTPELDEKFVKEAKAEDMVGLKGYRDLGGIRASLYNATTVESVEKLVAFMDKFYKANNK